MSLNGKIMNNFCILPFTHFSTRPNGDITPCCRYMGKLGNIKEQSIEDIWNGTEVKTLRNEFLNGLRPNDCWPCWQIEDSGGTSMRQSMLLNRNYTFKNEVEQDFQIPVIELKLSNLCNFRCRTCKPDLSTTWLKDWEEVRAEYESIGMICSTERQNYFDNENFLESIERLGSSIDILEFAGGEPLMDPLHYRILERLQHEASHIEVKYSTNLSRLSIGKWNVLDIWKNFKSVDLSVSMDGHPELNDYIRTESNTKNIVENLSLVRKELGNRFDGRIALCYSAYNAYDLPKSYDYFVNELKMPVHGNIAFSPIFINPQIIPKELKNIISSKYDEYLNSLDSTLMTSYHKKRINRFITTNRNFMLNDDLSNYWNQFKEFTKRLDRSRGTNIYSIIPEYEKW